MRKTTTLVACLLLIRKAQQREEVRMKVGMNRMSKNARKVSMTTCHWAHNCTLH
jgi:hypothetical protein